MASWTTSAKVTRHLQTNYASYLTTSVANLIIEASDIAYGHLTPRYWPFPDATDTPETPVIVQNAVAYLVAHLAMLELGRANEIAVPDNNQANNLLALYYDSIERLMSDDETRRAQVPPTVVSAETCDFGGDTDLGDNRYKFDPGGLGLEGFEVVPEATRIATFQYGTDFGVVFRPDFRGWLLERYNGDIADNASVTYVVDWLKRREITKPESRYGIELIRG